jgi:TetR/AcrR family transcriptional repressor of nem operon
MKENIIATKDRLLDSAYKEIYMNGFQGCSVDRILKDAKVTKGSMYHYYKSKQELGIGVIRERISPAMMVLFDFSNAEGKDEISKLKFKIQELSKMEGPLNYGCPMNKLVREMCSLDNQFRTALKDTYEIILQRIEELLEQAIENKNIKQCDTKSLTLFIYTAIIGNLSLGTGNATQDSFLSSLSHLFNYLESLKPTK